MFSSQADLLEFYDRNFSLGGAGRRKLSAWVYGNQHTMTTAVTVAAAGDGEAGQVGDGAVDTAKEAKDAAGASADGAGGDTCAATAADAGDAGASSGGGGRLAREVVVVEDYTEFKRSMPLLPLRKPTAVQAVDLEQSKL